MTAPIESPTSTWKTYRRGFRIQLNVIGALLMRELHTRYGRENIGYIWLILEPLTLASVIALIHSRGAAHFGSDIKPVPFAIVGYCNFLTFRSIFTRADGALEANQNLLYHRSVSIFDILFARATLDGAGSSLAFIVLMALSVGLGLSEPPARPLMLLLGMIAMFWFSFGLCMLICSATYENHGIARLLHPISYFMLPLGGTFIQMQSLPPEYRHYFSYVPLTHIFELLRYGQFRAAPSTFIDVEYLMGWLLIPTLLGMLAISHLRSRVHGA